MVISDVNMPGMKGPDLLSRIKRQYPETCTVLITAYNVDDYIRLARKSNISNIIPKTSPFNFSELESLLKSLLTREIFGLTGTCFPSTRTWQLLYQIVPGRQGSQGSRGRASPGKTRRGRRHAASGRRNRHECNLSRASFPDGTEKYEEFTEVLLEPHEFVYLECGFDPEKYGITVVDNKGD